MKSKVNSFKGLLVVFGLGLVLALGGCATNGGSQSQPYVSCTDAVAYISTIDAAIAALPAALPENAEEVAMAKAWYLVARSGAVAYVAKKCPEILPSLPAAPK
jgi:hypothetical protein